MAAGSEWWKDDTPVKKIRISQTDASANASARDGCFLAPPRPHNNKWRELPIHMRPLRRADQVVPDVQQMQEQPGGLGRLQRGKRPDSPAWKTVIPTPTERQEEPQMHSEKAKTTLSSKVGRTEPGAETPSTGKSKKGKRHGRSDAPRRPTA